jgi:hypothetical protein
MVEKTGITPTGVGKLFVVKNGRFLHPPPPCPRFGTNGRFPDNSPNVAKQKATGKHSLKLPD